MTTEKEIQDEQARHEMYICRCDCGRTMEVSCYDLEHGIATSCGQCDVPMKESEMTDTDKVTNLNQKRYEASLEFLDGPLLAASNAAHELSHVTDDDQANMIGCIALWAVNLCPAKLWLLEDIAHRLAKDEFPGADDCGDSDSH